MNSSNLKRQKGGHGDGNTDCIHWYKEESGVKSVRGARAAVGAEALSPLLCSVMGRFQRADLPEEEKKKNFIRIQSDTFVQLQSHCMRTLQGITCTFYQRVETRENREGNRRLRVEKELKRGIWGI